MMTILHLPSWFPNSQKPLDGNFILRHIAAVAPFTRSIMLRHTDVAFEKYLSMDDWTLFYPIFAPRKLSKVQLLHAYDKAFRAIIREYGKPDIIHLHVALPLGPVAVYLSTRYCIPLVVSEHWSVYQPQNRHLLSAAQRIQLKMVYRCAAAVTTVSDNLHNAIVETVPAAAGVPYHQVSNVVDTNLFTPNPSRMSDDGKWHILHVSTLENASKNIMGILRVVKALNAIRTDFVLDIIHDLGNAEAEQFIQDNNMGEYVRLLGKKTPSEVAEHIRQSAFMLQFSNYENQPCVLLESFACGKPVLATRVGGIPEIVDTSRGRLVAPKDENALLEQLQFMLDHSRDFDRDAIRDYAACHFSVRHIGQALYNIYGMVLKQDCTELPFEEATPPSGGC
ncbi:MAG: glycosyltransferase [Bacteroidales bacterium]|nr:glycosyltransferase [Bacteroidales bacterium]